MKRVPEIMVTIGPTLEKAEDLARAVEAGARWFRLPCGYRQRPHVENAQCIRDVGAECGIRLQLLLDLPLKSSKSIDLPDSSSPFTMGTDDGATLLAGFMSAGLVPDWVAFSMVSTAEDVRLGREMLRAAFGAGVRVMAKIETATGVENAESILREANAIMVARGDLGRTVEFIRLPEAQEQLVLAAKRAGKPVVVAAQILEYFAEVGVPLGSELSGLSLLAIQNPDVVMLGKETVDSPRPIESIRLAKELLTYETRRIESRRNRVSRCLAASLGRPYVVAIEGPNGAGKSRLCSLLTERLGLPCLRGVPAGWEDSPQKLRMIRDADWLASAMYFLSGVMESSREAASGAGDIKLMDRSLWSTLAVHYAHDPARLEVLLPLLELAAGHVKVPDLTIVLEASPATCQRRIVRKAGHEQAMDAASPATDVFHQCEREFYHWLAAQWPAVAFIDTDDCEPETVCQKAADLIRESFECCNC